MKLCFLRHGTQINTQKGETLPTCSVIKKILIEIEYYLTSFSIGSTQSACSLSSFIARTLLYGEVITSSSPEG